jgi:hypothetical protein
LLAAVAKDSTAVCGNLPATKLVRLWLRLLRPAVLPEERGFPTSSAGSFSRTTDNKRQLLPLLLLLQLLQLYLQSIKELDLRRLQTHRLRTWAIKLNLLLRWHRQL